MVRILIIAHGNLASALLASSKMLAGEHEAVDAIDFTPDIGADELKGLVEDYLAQHEGEQCLIACDLLGGTPFNVTARLVHQKPNYSILYGINLGLLVEAILTREDDLTELVNQLSESAPDTLGISSLGN